MSLARDIRSILGKGGPVGVLLALGLVASSMRADAAELLSVRIGLARTAEAGPLYIAVANGYFRDEGLDARLKFFDSDALVPAAAAGQVDIGVTSLNASFFGYAAKHGLKLIASEVSDSPATPPMPC